MTQDAYRKTDFSLPLDDRIRAYLGSVTLDTDYSGFDTHMLAAVTYVGADVEKRRTTFHFEVVDYMCNKDGVLHGGAASTLFDNLSSTSLFTIGKPGYWESLGVSRSLGVWFHHPLPTGSRVKLTCTVIEAGKRMATVRAVMETMDGIVCASCVHEKYLPLRSRL
ncbi:HotDog domain-containing protein [Aspergillus pseudocaelatus]|uniref:HotDog domain-containing protein n=1 Tax=Aspergillus pseudocaelatus TaxID=1825620 RepID=A0ABQ6WVE3_9EURO|nr:HotDog domain-containing protein [Aspergillus pseudocaelatus]